MATIYADRVRETTTTTGTGALALSGAVLGYQSFAAAMAINDTTYYTIQHTGGADWEVGTGTYKAGNLLERTTILASSNNGAIVNLAPGIKDIFITAPATLLEELKTNKADLIGGQIPLNQLPAIELENLANYDSTGLADGKTLVYNGSQWQLTDHTPDKTFTQAFTNLSAVTVTHNLNKYPSVTVVDSAGTEIEGDINHISLNQLTVNFLVTFTGTVYLN